MPAVMQALSDAEPDRHGGGFQLKSAVMWARSQVGRYQFYISKI